MAWYYVIYALALGGIPLSFISNRQLRLSFERIYFSLLLATLCLFAGLRSVGVDRDYSNYLYWFDSIKLERMTSMDWTKSPAFVFISSIVSGMQWNYVVVALICACLALIFKLWFSILTSENKWLPILFYLIVCHTFTAGEMTEIRSSVAIPLMSASIILANRDKKKLAIFVFALSITFHLGALIGFPIFLLVLLDVQFNSRGWILSLIPIGCVVVIALSPLLSLVADYGRISPYLNGDVDTGNIHYLSIYLWAHIVILGVILIFFWRHMSKEERLVMYCSAFGLCLLLVLHANDNIALRTSDFFELFDLLLFTVPLKYLKGYFCVAYAAFLMILGFALFQSSMQVVEPYRWIFS